MRVVYQTLLSVAKIRILDVIRSGTNYEKMDSQERYNSECFFRLLNKT